MDSARINNLAQYIRDTFDVKTCRVFVHALNEGQVIAVQTRFHGRVNEGAAVFVEKAKPLLKYRVIRYDRSCTNEDVDTSADYYVPTHNGRAVIERLKELNNEI